MRVEEKKGIREGCRVMWGRTRQPPRFFALALPGLSPVPPYHTLSLCSSTPPCTAPLPHITPSGQQLQLRSLLAWLSESASIAQEPARKLQEHHVRYRSVRKAMDAMRREDMSVR